MIKKRRGEKCFAPTFPIWMFFLPIIWHHANLGQNWGICESQLRYKLKSDKLLYKATALDESANSSAEQPVNAVGSQSSETKDIEELGERQTLSRSFLDKMNSRERRND